MKLNIKEKEYARNVYIKIANKVFGEYNKVYKAKQNTYKTAANIRPKKSSTIRSLGITYCVGSGIYGFLKGITKGR